MKKNEKTKKLTYAISLIMIFVVSIIMAFAPTTSAQVGITQPRQTQAFLSVAPMTIGVGQSLTVNMWVLPLPQNYVLGPAFLGFTNLTVTFTRPDGTKDTFAPVDGTNTLPAGQTEALGTIYFYYQPTAVGTWTAQFSMPAQNYTDSFGTVSYTACTSPSTTFTVQKDPVNAGIINGYPYSPLPNQNAYWTYPINSNNREWSTISGDWLNGPVYPGAAMAPTTYQPFGSGALSPHILWSTEQAIGGLIGGYLGSTSYSGSGIANTANAPAPIVLNGNVYFNLEGGQQWTGISITTGKTLFTASGQITFGIHIPGNSFSQGIQLATSYGAYPNPYLVYAASGSASWIFYDPLTGAVMRTITGVPQPVAGSQGTLLAPYPIAGALASKWTENNPIIYGYFQSGYNGTALQFAQSTIWAWNLTKVTGNVWNTGLIWNTTVNSPGHPNIGDGPGRSGIFLTPDEKVGVLCEVAGGENRQAGYDLATGKSIWNITTPFTNEAVYQVNNADGILVNWDPTFGFYYGYNMKTGAQLWKSDVIGTYPWGSFASGVCSDSTNIYIGTQSGQVYGLSETTGVTQWVSPIVENTTELQQGVLSTRTLFVAGGIVYAYYGYSISYEIMPIPRFAALVALNASTGQILWKLTGGVVPMAMAGGYLIGHGQNDGLLYCFGKGQTVTTVSAPTTVVTQGSTVLVQGSVLDQSSAQAGAPAVSESSMSQQMNYLHFQNATLLNNPPTEQGVEVIISAVDPNNNTVVLGTTTTDSSGRFGFTFAPSTTGMYTITATFGGSNSYWSSNSATKLAVSAAPSSTSTPSQSTSTGVSTTDFFALGAAIIIVVIIAAAAIILFQRKRP
jgi:outer membrane protein assembly factor BamB